jgi:K+-sensing histidine kinase KdpD
MSTIPGSEQARSDLSARPKTLHPGEKSGDHRLVREGLCELLAHDLKTSLASISMNLDFAMSELADRGIDTVSPALEDCKEANARVIRIVSEMADADRLAAGHYRMTLSQVSPGQLLDKAVRRARNGAAARDLQLATETDDTRVHADGELLSRVFDRLIERALRHARPGSHVRIQQRLLGLSIRVTTRASPGSDLTEPSLTMYFVQAAMAAMGGGARTEPADADGLLYVVVLPG